MEAFPPPPPPPPPPLYTDPSLSTSDIEETTTVTTPSTPSTPSTFFICSGLSFQIFIIVGSLVAVNVGLLVSLALISVHYPKFSSPGILAFTFGLRHAVDADHIAAIDNVSRKLISDGQKPLLVGFYFSLGHSTVVTLLCAGVAFGSTWLRKHLDNVKSVGAIVGTSVSAFVLLVVAGMNCVVAYRLVKSWRAYSAGQKRRRRAVGVNNTSGIQSPLLGGRKRRSRRSGPPSGPPPSGPTSSYVDPTSGLSFVMGPTHLHDDGAPEHTHMIVIDEAGVVAVPDEESSSSMGGCFTRCCPRLFGAVDASWKMYPIGFLFGLGFDTASEVALLGLTAMNAADIPSAMILVLPLLFAAGMSLIDTLDGILMLYAYSWASVDRRRKMFFNLYLTIISAFIAIVVAAVEILGLLSSELDWKEGWFWSWINSINNHFEYVGYSILGIFGLSMVVAAVLFKCCIGGGGQDEMMEAEDEDEDEEGGGGGGSGEVGGEGSGVGESKSTGTGISNRDKEADYLRSRLLNMARGNVQAIDI